VGSAPGVKVVVVVRVLVVVVVWTRTKVVGEVVVVEVVVVPPFVAVLPTVQVRTSPDWNRPSPVQSSPLKFCTGIGLVHNICALVWNSLDWCGLRYPAA
jgi:hypothetical protein